jgi:hypothetical protein
MGAQCDLVHLFSRRLETWVSSFLVKKGDKTQIHTQQSSKFFADSLLTTMRCPLKPKRTGQALVR